MLEGQFSVLELADHSGVAPKLVDVLEHLMPNMQWLEELARNLASSTQEAFERLQAEQVEARKHIENRLAVESSNFEGLSISPNQAQGDSQLSLATCETASQSLKAAEIAFGSPRALELRRQELVTASADVESSQLAEKTAKDNLAACTAAVELLKVELSKRTSSKEALRARAAAEVEASHREEIVHLASSLRKLSEI